MHAVKLFLRKEEVLWRTIEKDIISMKRTFQRMKANFHVVLINTSILSYIAESVDTLVAK